MRVIENIFAFRKNAKKPVVLALGNFDGIHLGHQKLLDYVVSQARQFQGQAAVFTFREHPQAVLHPGHAPERLQSSEQKLNFFRERGIEVCFLQHFDKRFAAHSAEDFVKNILARRLGIREICLGYNARFGRGRAGDADLLRKLGPECGFEVFQAKPVVWKGSPVSSTAVRAAVRDGKMDLAANLLGRPWSLAGKVLHGEARGKKLGFPTANLDLKGYVCPAFGVYAIRAVMLTSGKTKPAKKILRGVANLGVRPTFGGGRPVLEAHFFSFNKNIYGKKIEIFFLKKLRKEKKFKSLADLQKQIRKDIQAAQLVLKNKI